MTPNMHINALREQVLALEAEIERLQAGMREYACTATDHPCGCYDQFLSERAEIERLQKSQCDCQPKLIDLRADLEAKVERLRAALIKAETVMMIVEPRSHKGEYLEALAAIRAALEPKP